MNLQINGGKQVSFNEAHRVWSSTSQDREGKAASASWCLSFRGGQRKAETLKGLGVTQEAQLEDPRPGAL